MGASRHSALIVRACHAVRTQLTVPPGGQPAHDVLCGEVGGATQVQEVCGRRDGLVPVAAVPRRQDVHRGRLVVVGFSQGLDARGGGLGQHHGVTRGPVLPPQGGTAHHAGQTSGVHCAVEGQRVGCTHSLVGEPLLDLLRGDTANSAEVRDN